MGGCFYGLFWSGGIRYGWLFRLAGTVQYECDTMLDGTGRDRTGLDGIDGILDWFDSSMIWPLDWGKVSAFGLLAGHVSFFFEYPDNICSF